MKRFTLFLCFLLLLILCSCEKNSTASSLSPQSDAVTEKAKGLQEITTFSEGDIYLTPSSLTLSDLFLQGTDVCCLLAQTECDVIVARFYSESVSFNKSVGATVQNCYVQLYHFQKILKHFEEEQKIIQLNLMNLNQKEHYKENEYIKEHYHLKYKEVNQV